MTKETASIIESGFDKLLDDIENSIVMGSSEEVGPNSNEYNDLIDKYWSESIDRLQNKLNNYIELH